MKIKHNRRAGAPVDKERPRPRLGFRFVLTVALIAIVAGVIVVGAVTRPAARSPAAPDTTTTTITIPITPGQPAPPQNIETPSSIASGKNPDIPNPQPWQYDPATDKHWDADHGHWHPGRPPSVSDPEPWQYDPASNKFWHPGHKHWHAGRPPPPDQR
jgi:hypothetical protein